MGKHLKATKACLNNLTKGSSNSCRLTVEEVQDSDGDDAKYLPKSSRNGIGEEQGTFFFVEDYLDLGAEPDMDSMSDSDLDEEEEVEINDDIALLTFSLMLRRAWRLLLKQKSQKKVTDLKVTKKTQNVPRNSGLRNDGNLQQKVVSLWTLSSHKRKRCQNRSPLNQPPKWPWRLKVT